MSFDTASIANDILKVTGHFFFMVLIYISLIGLARTWLYDPFMACLLPVLYKGIIRAFTDVKVELHKFKLQCLP